MVLSRRNIFLKSWIWGLVTGAVLVMIFWIVADVFSLLKSGKDIVTFVNVIILISVLGNILGAGIVMWRILDKYHKTYFKPCLKRYIWLNIISLILLGGVLFYNPISFLSALWSLIAPLAVIYSMSKAHVQFGEKAKS